MYNKQKHFSTLFVWNTVLDSCSDRLSELTVRVNGLEDDDRVAWGLSTQLWWAWETQVGV